MWNSRSEREKKVKCYESLLPGNKEGIAYLWEDEKVEITND
jgi:hypothetical protein